MTLRRRWMEKLDVSFEEINGSFYFLTQHTHLISVQLGLEHPIEEHPI